MPTTSIEFLINPQRLDKLHRLCLLDSPADPAFDRLTRLATRMINVPVALVSLIDANRQFFKSQVGLPEPWATNRQTPLSHSFCQHLLATGSPLIIENAPDHPLVYDNLAISDLNAIAYAGFPLRVPSGDVLGSFCVIDSQPRSWTEFELDMLRDLAAAVMTEIELLAELIERKRIENDLREKDAFLEKVMNTVPLVITIFDLDERQIVFSNENSIHNLGYAPDKLYMLGSEVIQTVVHPDFWEPLKAHQVALLQLEDGQVAEFDYKVQDTQGSTHWVRNRDTIYKRKPDGRPCQIISSISDITEQKRAEQQSLELAVEIEKQKTQALRRFISQTAHDFRTPLSIINTSLFLHENDPRTEKKPARIEAVRAQTNFLTRMINELQAFFEMGEADQLPRTTIEIDHLLRQTHQTIREHAINKKLKVEVHMRQDELTVYGNVMQLEHALRRLAENAVNYTPHGGTITLSAHRDNQTIVIEVRDSGSGIEPEDVPHIFEMFYKGNKARTQDGNSGVGIGLTLVKRVVELHRGQIEVHSVVGQGSLFRLTLPAFSGR